MYIYCKPKVDCGDSFKWLVVHRLVGNCKPKVDCGDSFKWLVVHRLVGKTPFQPLLYLSDKLNTNTDRCYNPICFQLYYWICKLEDPFQKINCAPQANCFNISLDPKVVLVYQGHLVDEWYIFSSLAHLQSTQIWSKCVMWIHKLKIPFVAEFLHCQKFTQLYVPSYFYSNRDKSLRLLLIYMYMYVSVL